jgi:hypothetical protein
MFGPGWAPTAEAARLDIGLIFGALSPRPLTHRALAASFDRPGALALVEPRRPQMPG